MKDLSKKLIKIGGFEFRYFIFSVYFFIIVYVKCFIRKLKGNFKNDILKFGVLLRIWDFKKILVLFYVLELKIF